MATVDQIQARLSAMITRVIETGRLSTQPGPGPDWESAEDLAEQIEARLMQPASQEEEAETPSTPTQPRQDKQDKQAMPHLTDEIKTFIVKGLACYDTPSQVAEAVRVNFDIVVSRQQVHEYDPACARPPAQRWRELHAATRAALLRETAEIGIAHRAVRLLRLDRLASRCERNSVRTALKCLEMAAKECGGWYENRRPVVSQPAAQPAATQTETPYQAAAPAATPQPAATRPAKPKPPATRMATPRPAAPSHLLKQPSMPERPAPQAPALQPHAPKPRSQPTPLARATPSLSEPLPQPDMPAPAAPQPLAEPAQAPQAPALPEERPLSRHERHLAYVRDRHARDRAVATQARLNNGSQSAGS